ncbi:hypothetical protein ABXV18_27205 [Vibrio owensii]|uniref:hypothetical protein n=1 Tax=Vibrio owensii TaxID=696485 RepID=UPI00339080E9
MAKKREFRPRVTVEDFLSQATKIHSGKYDYSNVTFTATTQRGEFYCPVHKTAFSQRFSDHMKGSGCPLCGRERTTAHNKSNTEKFIKKASLVHGEKYCYDSVVYVQSDAKVTITCSKHGDFDQSPNHHLCGRGCPACAGKKPAKA